LLILQDRRALEVFFAAMCSRGNPSGKPGVIEGIRRFLHPVRVGHRHLATRILSVRVGDRVHA